MLCRRGWNKSTLCAFVLISIYTYLILKRIKRIHKSTWNKVRFKNALKVGKWGEPKVKAQKDNRARSEPSINVFMKICMVDKYSFVSKSHFNPLLFCVILSLHLRLATDIILINKIEQKYFQWLIGKNFYFLIIVKQFYIIPWQRPSSSSLCLWIWNMEVTFGALAIIWWPCE